MTAEQHEWDRGTLRWDVYFAIILAATLVLIAIRGDTTVQRIIAGAALVALVPLYLVLGRPAIIHDRNAAQGTAYLVCLVVLVAVAQSQVGSSSWVLCAACPQCFMVAPLWRALIGVGVLNLAPVAFLLESSPHGQGQAVYVVGIAVIGLAFSVAFGGWVTRIIVQSRERADLIKQLRDAQAELAEMSRRAGTLAERQRLAGDIHDTIAQGLTSIVMLLQAAEAEIAADSGEARRHIGLAATTARENLAEARAMVAALMPTHLNAGTLGEALGRLTDRIGAELGIEASFEVSGTARPVPSTVEVVLLRACQEALANVRKHSGARHVRVCLSYADGVRLEVTDDGIGFQPDRVAGGFGLRGMRDRIVQTGGSLQVRSRLAAGTSLSVQVPG